MGNNFCRTDILDILKTIIIIYNYPLISEMQHCVVLMENVSFLGRIVYTNIPNSSSIKHLTAATHRPAYTAPQNCGVGGLYVNDDGSNCANNSFFRAVSALVGATEDLAFFVFFVFVATTTSSVKLAVAVADA